MSKVKVILRTTNHEQSSQWAKEQKQKNTLVQTWNQHAFSCVGGLFSQFLKLPSVLPKV